MTNETPSDPSAAPEHGPESDKPIILGGPAAPSEEPPASGRLEPEAEPAPEPEAAAPEPAPAFAPYPAEPPAPPPRKRSVLLPLLGLLGFVILAAAIGYLWVRVNKLPATAAGTPAGETSAVTALQSAVASLKTELAALDARETSDVANLKSQLAALDTRESSDVAGLHTAIAALPPPAPAAPAPAAAASPTPTASAAPEVAQAAAVTAVTQTVASLSDRLKQLESAEAAQAQQTQSLPSASDVSNLGARVDAIAQRESKDDSAIRQDLSLVQQQLAALSDQAKTLTKTSEALPQLAARADKLSQIVRAQEALRAGLPLGTIADAPPALARFADSAPPTEAALRLSFTDAARAADKAGEPVPDQGNFWHRIWVRAQNLVMVRQGDHIILGDPTGAILNHAQTVLDAGDIAGALTVLGTLTDPAAAAMAPWEAQARALLQAREALTQMAAG